MPIPTPTFYPGTTWQASPLRNGLIRKRFRLGTTWSDRIVERRIEVPVDRIVERRVEVPVDRIVEKRVEVPVEVRVEVPVDRIVEKVVPVEVRVEVPVERIIEKVVEVPVPAPGAAEVPSLRIQWLQQPERVAPELIRQAEQNQFLNKKNANRLALFYAIAASDGTQTLEEIANQYGVTETLLTLEELQAKKVLKFSLGKPRIQ
jgi:hypothetical protein